MCPFTATKLAFDLPTQRTYSTQDLRDAEVTLQDLLENVRYGLRVRRMFGAGASPPRHAWPLTAAELSELPF